MFSVKANSKGNLSLHYMFSLGLTCFFCFSIDCYLCFSINWFELLEGNSSLSSLARNILHVAIWNRICARYDFDASIIEISDAIISPEPYLWI